MWGIRITIVRTDNCAELKFRHNFKLDDIDMALLYNGAPSQGHYNALIKVGKELSTYKLNCKEVKRSNNYDPNIRCTGEIGEKICDWRVPESVDCP